MLVLGHCKCCLTTFDWICTYWYVCLDAEMWHNSCCYIKAFHSPPKCSNEIWYTSMPFFILLARYTSICGSAFLKNKEDPKRRKKKNRLRKRIFRLLRAIFAVYPSFHHFCTVFLEFEKQKRNTNEISSLLRPERQFYCYRHLIAQNITLKPIKKSRQPKTCVLTRTTYINFAPSQQQRYVCMQRNAYNPDSYWKTFLRYSRQSPNSKI